MPVVLAGDYNVVPTDADIYPTASWTKDALCSRKAAPRSAACSTQGWTDAIRTLHPDEPMYTFWDYMRNRWPRDAGLRLDHLLLMRGAPARLSRAGVDREVRGEDERQRSRAGMDHLEALEFPSFRAPTDAAPE